MDKEEKKDIKKYGRTNLRVEDTYNDLMDLDEFEKWILEGVRKREKREKDG